MPTPPRHLTVDGVIDSGPAELLTSLGFRRARRNFSRQVNDLFHSVCFQTVRNAPFCFCVNCSVLLPFHHEVIRGVAFPISPSVDNAARLLGSRLRFPTETVHWLSVSPDSPAESLGALVISLLPSGIQFLDPWQSADQVCSALGSPDPDLFPHQPELHRAILLVHLGRREEARALLASIRYPIAPAILARLGFDGRGDVPQETPL